MAVRAPLYYSSSGDLKAMSSGEVDQIIAQTIYQYSLAPSVVLTRVNSGGNVGTITDTCLLYTSPSPRDKRQSRMPSSA